MYFRSVILQGFTGLGHLFAVLVYYKYHQRPHACSISTEDDPIPKQPTTTHNLFGYNTTTAHKVVSRNSSPDDEVLSHFRSCHLSVSYLVSYYASRPQAYEKPDTFGSAPSARLIPLFSTPTCS